MLTSFPPTGFDARFPNQNQTKHCWQNYVDYHKCIIAKGEDFAPCRQVRLNAAYGVWAIGLTICSSCWLTSRSAPAAGPRDGTTSARLATSQSTSTSKLLATVKLVQKDVKRWGRVDHRLAYAPQYLYHIDRHKCSLDSTIRFISVID